MDNMKCQCVILSALTIQVLPSSFLLFLLTTPSSLASFPYLFPASKLYSVNATIIIFVSVLYFPLSLLPSPSLFHIHLFPLSLLLQFSPPFSLPSSFSPLPPPSIFLLLPHQVMAEYLPEMKGPEDTRYFGKVKDTAMPKARKSYSHEFLNF